MSVFHKRRQSLKVDRSRWMKDSDSESCLDCKRDFTVFKRRHHCRQCGKLFCYRCTQFRANFEGNEKSSRVCRNCYNNPRNVNFQEEEFSVVGRNVRDCEASILQPARSWSDAMEAEFLGVELEKLFEGKEVALFNLPGPFTDVCAEKHIPNISQNIKNLRQAGVTDIIILSVCDPYSLNAWIKTIDLPDVSWFSDIDGLVAKFVRAETEFKFAGLRSNRYAMIVNDGIIYWFAQEDSPTDVIKTRAESLLEFFDARCPEKRHYLRKKTLPSSPSA